MASAVIEFRRRRKRQAVEYKGGKCQKCGYCKCIRALEFHHQDDKDHDLDGTRGGFNMSVSWERLKVELDKCILLCANCHREVEEELECGNLAIFINVAKVHEVPYAGSPAETDVYP